MRRFEAGISALTVLATVLVAGLADARAQSVPADIAGPWTITNVMAAPWATSTRADRALVGATVAFNAGRMAGRNAFTCGNAAYEVVQSEPRGLFQGGLAEATAERDATTLGIANPATTLSVTCDTGIFDFHKAGVDLVIGFDNQILRLKRARK